MPGSKKCSTSRASKVYRKVLRADAKRRGIPILRTRWVDVDNGDDHEHNYRSRFVAMEFNTQKLNGLHASTPPLEALKLFISGAATRTSDTFEEEEVIMVNDVARAYFEAKVERTIAIELPDEGKAEGQDMVGILEKSLYGTRDAALNFQKGSSEIHAIARFCCGKVQLQYLLAQGQGHQSHGARRRLRVSRLALIAEVVQVPASTSCPRSSCRRVLWFRLGWMSKDG